MFSIWLNVLLFTVASPNAQIEESRSLPLWLIIPLALTLVALLIYVIARFLKQAQIVVGELEVGTVFTKGEGDFVKFLKPQKGIHWINPFSQKAGDKIPLGTQTTSGKAENLRTKEGIPLAIEYHVSFSMDPFASLPSIHHKMARALPKYAPNMVGGRVNHVLRHLVEQKSIYELYQEDAVKKLEEEVRAEVHNRGKAIGLNVITANDMKLGPIHMPQQVEKALKADYERKLQTTTSIDALERLHAVVSKFSEQDMERLAELERLRIVENSGSSVYLMDSLVKKVRETAVSNGHDNSSKN